MVKNLYRDDGFLNFRTVRDLGYPFTYLIGGRGTGKTYGGLSTSVADGLPFILMQRSQTQLDVINNPNFSPFKKINQNEGWHVITKAVTKNSSAFYHGETDKKGRTVPAGPPLGYTLALSTISNVRGFDGSDVELILFDEFIPEKNARTIRNEAETLMSAYETVARNRELEGRKPLQLFLMANALDLGNCHLLYSNLVGVLDRMERKGQEFYTDDKRGICVIRLADSPISEAKADTALYRMMGQGSDYTQMALSNTFAYEDRTDVRSRPLAEYSPAVTVGEITVYKHKSRRLYYVSTHRSGSPEIFAAGEMELARFRRAYAWLWTEIMERRVEFEDILSQTLLTKYLQ